MTYDQIIKDLKNKIYKPIYFLMGEETYYIDKITDYITANVLTDSEKDFNQSTLYGKETDVNTIISASRRFPMMANQQVIVVKEAQNIKNIEDLLIYVEKPLNSTILVINYKYKKLDKRKKIYKAIDKAGVLFEAKKKYDNEIPQWISSYLSSKKYKIEPSASMLLSEYLGVNLSKIANELDKLMITLPDGVDTINSDHIEKNIGISKDYNNFELHKALGEKNVLKSNRIINYFANNQKDNNITVTITSLYFYFSKVLAYYFIKNKSDNREVASVLQVNPYFVNDYKNAAKKYTPAQVVNIISLLREYDLKSKGVDSAGTPAGELLKELVFKILH